LLLPSSLFTSALLPVPTDRFRVDYGRMGLATALAAWQESLAH